MPCVSSFLQKKLHKLIIWNRLIVDSLIEAAAADKLARFLQKSSQTKSLISHYFSLVLDVVLLNGVEWTFLSLAAFFVHHQRIRSKIFIFGNTRFSVKRNFKKISRRQQNIKTHKWGETGNVAAHSFLAFFISFLRFNRFFPSLLSQPPEKSRKRLCNDGFVSERRRRDSFFLAIRRIKAF